MIRNECIKRCAIDLPRVFPDTSASGGGLASILRSLGSIISGLGGGGPVSPGVGAGGSWVHRLAGSGSGGGPVTPVVGGGGSGGGGLLGGILGGGGPVFPVSGGGGSGGLLGRILGGGPVTPGVLTLWLVRAVAGVGGRARGDGHISSLGGGVGLCGRNGSKADKSEGGAHFDFGGRN